EDAVGAEVDGDLRELDGVRRVVAAGAGEHGHALVRRLHNDLHHALVLVARQRRVLAGRAAGHEEVDALADLPFDEALQRRLVERAGLLEWSDQGCTDSAKFHDITSSSKRKNPLLPRSI